MHEAQGSCIGERACKGKEGRGEGGLGAGLEKGEGPCKRGRRVLARGKGAACIDSLTFNGVHRGDSLLIEQHSKIAMQAMWDATCTHGHSGVTNQV